MFLPEHMNRWLRNERLYEYLKGMGLVVSVKTLDDDPDKIDYICVSADIPEGSLSAMKERAASDLKLKNLPSTGVGGPLEGPEVDEIIGPTITDRPNVVDFPTVV